MHLHYPTLSYNVGYIYFPNKINYLGKNDIYPGKELDFFGQIDKMGYNKFTETETERKYRYE